MKKTTLYLLAAGFLASAALGVQAQNQTAQKEVKKNTQNTQGVQTASAQSNQATAAKPVVTSKPGAAASANPQVKPVNAAPRPAGASAVAPQAPPVPLTCTWDVTDYDFGKNVIQLKPASATFTITNAGKDPVTITQVQPSCGCTSPKYTKEPIKPGEKGEVVLTYDAKISGYFSKSAQVRLNDGQRYSLTIKGEVQKTDAPPAVEKNTVK
jgi:hypothetical protein